MEEKGSDSGNKKIKKDLITEKITGRRLTPLRILKMILVAMFCGAAFATAGMAVVYFSGPVLNSLSARTNDPGGDQEAQAKSEDPIYPSSWTSPSDDSGINADISSGNNLSSPSNEIASSGSMSISSSGQISGSDVTRSQVESIGMHEPYEKPQTDGMEEESLLSEETDHTILQEAITDELSTKRREDLESIEKYMVTIEGISSGRTWFENEALSSEKNSGVIIDVGEDEILILTRDSAVDFDELDVSFYNGISAPAYVKQISRHDSLAVVGVSLRPGEEDQTDMDTNVGTASQIDLEGSKTSFESAPETSRSNFILPKAPVGQGNLSQSGFSSLSGLAESSSVFCSYDLIASSGVSDSSSLTDNGDLSESLFDIKAVQFPEKEDIYIGQTVTLAGSPFGMAGSFAFGNVGYISKDVSALDTLLDIFYVNTKVDVQKGTFILTPDGKLLGVACETPDTSEETTADNVSAIISSYSLLDTVNRLKRGEQIAFIGIEGENLDEDMTISGIPEGIYVKSVELSGPAYEAGVMRGDIITSLNGHELRDMSDLTASIRYVSPGDEITITCMRASGNEEYEELEFSGTAAER